VQVNRSRYETARTLTAQYLESQLTQVADDPYSLSIVCYALTLANSSRAFDALQLLNGLAIHAREWCSTCSHVDDDQSFLIYTYSVERWQTNLKQPWTDGNVLKYRHLFWVGRIHWKVCRWMYFLQGFTSVFLRLCGFGCGSPDSYLSIIKTKTLP